MQNLASFIPYLILILAWIFYLATHSILASHRVKKTICSLGVSARIYRLLYSLWSVVLLVVLLWLNGSIEGARLIPQRPEFKYAGMLLAGGCILVLRAAFKHYSIRAFLGIISPEKEDQLQTRGILSRIRHPIYTATILLTAGFLLFDPRIPTLVSMICIWIYLPLGIFLEEKKLIREFGHKYIDYRRKVPAILPRFRL